MGTTAFKKGNLMSTLKDIVNSFIKDFDLEEANKNFLYNFTNKIQRTTGNTNVSVTQSGQDIKITINGKTYHTTGKNVTVANRDIIIDGKKFEPDDDEEYDNNTQGFHLSIESDTVVEIKTTEPITAQDIKGNVTCGALHAGDIEGDVFSTGPVNCGDIDGSVSCEGPINCGDIDGNLKAKGPVNCGDIKSMD